MDLSGSGLYLWFNFKQTFITYNTKNNPTEIRIQINLPDKPWHDAEKTIYTYTDFDSIKTERVQVLQGDNLVDSTLLTYTYNASKIESGQLFQEWKNNAWIDIEKVDFTYENVNKITKAVFQTFNNGNWKNSLQILYNYTVDIKRGELSKHTSFNENIHHIQNQNNVSINFSLANSSAISLHIYDLKGNLVHTLIQGKKMSGKNSILWDKTDNKGSPLSAGIYVYQLRIDKRVVAKQVILAE